MKGALIHISGNWAHFKKPETNNNPLTHDFITKTALIGMIGAILGIERNDMKAKFPELSENLLYGVQIQSAVKKESWAFTLRKAANLFEKAPKQMEFLKNPNFLVAVALLNSHSEKIFDDFIFAVERSEAMFTPVLGLHNCPANLELISTGEFTEQNSAFVTKGFVTKQCVVDMSRVIQEKGQIRLGFERIPTYQNDDFWNLPEKYVEVLYPSEQHEIPVKENRHYQFTDGSRWILI
ncbi:MAG: CRISPR-associated protein Cas5 [Chloroherpetonaceae bacterium]